MEQVFSMTNHVLSQDRRQRTGNYDSERIMWCLCKEDRHHRVRGGIDGTWRVAQARAH